ADQGDPLAQYLLGATYQQGRGVTQDYVEAAKWFRCAADQGVTGAQYVLGMMYAVGDGVPEDLVRAHMWLNLAGAQSFQDAGEFRDEVARRMTPAQIAEAQKLAREWKPKLEQRGVRQRCCWYQLSRLQSSRLPPALHSPGFTVSIGTRKRTTWKRRAE